MPVRPLILSPPIVVRALRDDPADLLVRAGGGQRWRALRALFSMTQHAHCIGATPSNELFCDDLRVMRVLRLLA